MAAKQPVAPPQDSAFASHVAGMSKNKLYDIMSRMKSLMEQNHQQAKQILVENPALTKSLFQAQIMLGMVRPAKQTTNSQQTLPQQPQPSGQADQKPIVPPPQPMHIDTGVHEEAGGSQRQPAVKQELQPSASFPPLDFQSQAVPSSSVPPSHQGKGALNVQIPPISLGQNPQIHNVPPVPTPLQQPPFQLHAQVPSSQMHHSVPVGKVIHQPLQAPMLSNIRPPLQQFPHQLHTQTSHNIPFQPSSTNPQLISQPMYQLGSGPPTSFPQGQPPLPVQPPPQHLYQGGPQVGMDYGSQTAKPMQVDRVAPWASGPPENTMPGSQFAGPPPLQMNPGQPSQALRLPQLSSEMEKALLQQVMSLTPEQINLLPPEQRQQVLQLQQMLR